MKAGHLERTGNLYSFTTIDSTGWMVVIAQPKSVAYKPVRDLLDKITIPAACLIVLTAVGAGLAGRFTPAAGGSCRGGSNAKLSSTKRSSPTCRAASPWSILNRATSFRPIRPSAKWRNASAHYHVNRITTTPAMTT